MRMCIVLALVVAACGGSNGEDSTSAQGGSGGGSGGFMPTGSGGGFQITEVYGHSASQLYKLEPATKTITVVGPFDGCEQVADIAIDRDNHIVATTFDGLYRVDAQTADCSLIAAGNYPNSLSYVPAGTLDADEEALVGYEGATYVRIDPSTGLLSQVGSLGGGPVEGFSSSGDIVSVEGGGTFLTVTGAGCGDCLISIDPATGSAMKNYGALEYGEVYGLAFWGGRAYGFASSGDLFEISFVGSTVETSPIPIPNAPAALRFWGAGSSTSVPVDIPK